MKTITLYQPWASLVMTGDKMMETRSWNTKHRGPLLIHAAAVNERRYENLAKSLGFEFLPSEGINYHALPFGAVLGCVYVVNTVPVANFKTYVTRLFSSNDPHLPFNKEKISLDDYLYKENAMGDYSVGRYFWHLYNPIWLDVPIPAKGTQRIWDFELPEPLKYILHAHK